MFFSKKQNIITDPKKVEQVLTRGVADILPTKEKLKELLLSGKRIRLYQGFEPTGKDLHIGHMVGLRKLKQFQELGHEVIFLIGDGTGQAGDPSGKSKTRETFFNREELRKNALDYVSQAKYIVNFSGNNPITIKYNGDWLHDLALSKFLGIAQHFSVQQLIERDMFQERLKKGESINMREFIYPLLQGYDSVVMDVDLELGGTDQTFNMLAGRTLCKAMLDKEKFVLTTPLLADATGKKIGKTEGNVIGLTNEPRDLFGKIMRLGDDVIVSALEYLTDIPLEEIHTIEQKIANGENPKQFKELLAYEIITQLQNESVAKDAKDAFTKTFSEGDIPDNIQTLSVIPNTPLADILVENAIVSSKSEWRRLIDQNAVTNLENGERITKHDMVVTETLTLKIGKKIFIRIEPNA